MSFSANSQGPRFAPLEGDFSPYTPMRTVPLKELFDRGEFDKIPVTPSKAEAIYTNSQGNALRQLVALASAYFSGVAHSMPLKPRFNALLVAATGTGKTKISRDLAERTGSEFISVSVGEWVVRGATFEPSTLTSILRVLERSPKTVLLLDELDKFCSTTDSAWIRFCAAEIWALLDRRLPIEDFCLKTSGGPELIDTLRWRLDHGLYIIGAGTFQSVWEKFEKRSCGFNGADSSSATDDAVMAAIRKQDIVSPELLSRFGPKPIVLRYPTRSEIPELLERFGLNRLAGELGVTIDPATITLEGVGMRAFEQLGAELLVARTELSHIPLASLDPRP